MPGRIKFLDLGYNNGPVWVVTIERPNKEQLDEILAWLSENFPLSVPADDSVAKFDEKCGWAYKLAAERTVDFMYDRDTFKIKVPARSRAYGDNQFKFLAEFALGDVVAVQFKLRYGVK